MPVCSSRSRAPGSATGVDEGTRPCREGQGLRVHRSFERPDPCSGPCRCSAAHHGPERVDDAVAVEPVEGRRSLARRLQLRYLQLRGRRIDISPRLGAGNVKRGPRKQTLDHAQLVRLARKTGADKRFDFDMGAFEAEQFSYASRKSRSGQVLRDAELSQSNRALSR